MIIERLNKLRIGYFLAAVGLLLLFPLPGALVCHAAGFPAPSGKFTFEGKPHIGTAALTNTTVTNASLFLNGEYGSGKGYTAVFRPTVFHYERFTIVVKLRPEKTSPRNMLRSQGTVLLAGGEACRWLVLSSDEGGEVELSLNNHEFCHPIQNLTVTNGQWTTLAMTVDLQAKTIVTYADGNRVDELLLPKDFVLDVMNDETWKESDKVLTFTDYSDGGTIHGYIAELLTFDSILTGEQVGRLFWQRAEMGLPYIHDNYGRRSATD